MQGMLNGSSAIVVGGGRGIGYAVAKRLSEQGAKGLIFDLPDVIEPATQPPAFEKADIDVSSEQSIAAAFARVASEFDTVDIVVANAGIVPPWRQTEDIDLDEWDRVFSINVRGVAATLKHAVPLMKKRGGSIVVTASINGVTGAPLQGAYTSSKHAVLGLVRCSALELGQYGIRVNAVGPGPVLTDALRERIRFRSTNGGPTEAEAERLLAEQTPLGRIATEDDVADGVLFLASKLSAAITGHLLPIDAGFRIT
ncbi:MAG: SDR family oxidoreductase [Rhizobiaceae bacterium]|nr:SDR family oxidoreductase [Rhizobiaceae bacterium]